MRRHRIFRSLALAAPAFMAWAPIEVMARPGPETTRHSTAPRRDRSIFDNVARMDVNNLDMFVTNHGSYAWDLMTGNPGLVYPKGSTRTVVFAGGLWIGAKVGGETRLAVGGYSQEFVPGPMLGGTYQLDRPEFRSYRIDSGGTGYADYLANAIPQGAPVDAHGNPLLLGDATIWSVFNDADANRHTDSAGSTAPLGLEVQQTVFAFARGGPLGNAIFMMWKLINRGVNALDSAYVSIWSDPDLGDPSDDLVGCDTTLALGYCYNATNSDNQYGAMPPAVGFELLLGPRVRRSPGVYDTLGVVAFNKYINGTDPSSAAETYNYMRGLHPDGSPLHAFDDPAQPVTTFQVSGDPVAGTGWLDLNEADRRLMLSTGPFTMAPGDSQVIAMAILVGQGTDRLSSITALRSMVDVARQSGRPPSVEPLSVSAPPAQSIEEGKSGPLRGGCAVHAPTDT